MEENILKEGKSLQSLSSKRTPNFYDIPSLKLTSSIKKKMTGDGFYTIAMPLTARHIQTMNVSPGFMLISSFNFLTACFT